MNCERSVQSYRIQFGNNIEIFWNKVFSYCSGVQNLIEDNDRIDVNGKSRQIDCLFKTINSLIYYLEMKCNLDFDSEKVKASNAKVQEISNVVGANVSGYFCPVADEIDGSVNVKYNNKGLKVFSVNDVIEIIGDECPFTSEEYFSFLKFAGSILKDKYGF